MRIGHSPLPREILRSRRHHPCLLCPGPRPPPNFGTRLAGLTCLGNPTVLHTQGTFQGRLGSRDAGCSWGELGTAQCRDDPTRAQRIVRWARQRVACVHAQRGPARLADTPALVVLGPVVVRLAEAVRGNGRHVYVLPRWQIVVGLVAAAFVLTELSNEGARDSGRHGSGRSKKRARSRVSPPFGSHMYICARMPISKIACLRTHA